MKDGKRFVIVGAGSLAPGDLAAIRDAGDFICAADAGYQALISAGIEPDLLIGDFDSMDAPDASCETIRLPVVKDDTDTVYAVREGFRRGFDRFVLYGALGGSRVSHTFANVQLLSMIAEMGGSGELVQGRTRVFLLRQGEVRTFPPGTKGILSVFSLTESAEVSLSGLFYPLDHGTLNRNFPLGVSNHFTGDPSEIAVHRGEVLAVTEEE